MAHAGPYHDTRQKRAPKRGGNTFLGFMAGVVLVIALLIGWAVYSGNTPDLRADSVDVDVTLPKPRVPDLPTVPNPDPLPAPTPSRPG